MSEVDDFLGLGGEPLAHLRWLALAGRSGSGKSTVANWLVETHPDFAGARRLDSRPLSFEAAATSRGELWFVDEITTMSHLFQAMAMLSRGNRLLIATHLPSWCMQPLRAVWPGRYLRTDVSYDKLSRYLQQRDITTSESSLRRYTRRFGATYTDLDLILEASPSRDFDRSLALFERLHQVDISLAEP